MIGTQPPEMAASKLSPHRLKGKVEEWLRRVWKSGRVPREARKSKMERYLGEAGRWEVCARCISIMRSVLLSSEAQWKKLEEGRRWAFACSLPGDDGKVGRIGEGRRTGLTK